MAKFLNTAGGDKESAKMILSIQYILDSLKAECDLNYLARIAIFQSGILLCSVPLRLPIPTLVWIIWMFDVKKHLIT